MCMSISPTAMPRARGGHRPLQSARVPRPARPVLCPETPRGRLHLALFAGRRGPGQPVDSQRHQRRAFRRAPYQRGRTLYLGTPEPDRLVSELDRRTLYHDRPAGRQPGRGDRGNPHPGQERGRLREDRARRHPAPPRRHVDCRVHRGRDRGHGARDPAPWPEGGGPSAIGREATLYAARPASICGFSMRSTSTTNASTRWF